jgi:hypothetical protein
MPKETACLTAPNDDDHADGDAPNRNDRDELRVADGARLTATRRSLGEAIRTLLIAVYPGVTRTVVGLVGLASRLSSHDSMPFVAASAMAVGKDVNPWGDSG